jgi:hypothetical protein
MPFSFYENLSRHIPGLRQAKQAMPLPSAICLCREDFCSMVGLIFDVPVG